MGLLRAVRLRFVALAYALKDLEASSPEKLDSQISELRRRLATLESAARSESQRQNADE